MPALCLKIACLLKRSTRSKSSRADAVRSRLRSENPSFYPKKTAKVKRALKVHSCRFSEYSDTVAAAQAMPDFDVSDLLLVQDQQTANRSLRQCPNFGGVAKQIEPFSTRAAPYFYFDLRLLRPWLTGASAV